MNWSGIYRGIVHSTADPDKQGRIRLRVAQVSGTAVSGWAPAAQPGGGMPSVGQQVWVVYEGGNPSYPTYIPPIPPPPDPPTPAAVLVQDWTGVTLASGYTPNGNTNGVPLYRVVDLLGSRRVEWQGAVNVTYSSGSPVNGGLIVAAPMPVTPSTLRSVTAACSQNGNLVSLKVDFWPNGDVKIVGPSSTAGQPAWFSLNNVSYYL